LAGGWAPSRPPLGGLTAARTSLDAISRTRGKTAALANRHGLQTGRGSRRARLCLADAGGHLAVDVSSDARTPNRPGQRTRTIRTRDPQPHLLNAEIAAREFGEHSPPDALAFCLLLAEIDPPRFDRAIARWQARFVLAASGITADEAALALSAAKGLAGLKTRELGAQTLRQIARQVGLTVG
jgi:hypothetical protein